jgi:hypothetical protein
MLVNNCGAIYEGVDLLGEFENGIFVPSAFLLDCSPEFQQKVDKFANQNINHILNYDEVKDFETVCCFANQIGKTNKALLIVATIKGVTYRVEHNHKVALQTSNFQQAVEKYNELT